MSSTLLIAPAVEPLTLAEAKAFLRVEHADDDDLIAALIAGARIHIESATRRALITQTWRMARDAWPQDGRLRVTPLPLRTLAAARVMQSDGSPLAISPSAFTLDREGGVIAFTPGALPPPGRAVAGIELDVEAGYGGVASDVPEPLRQAIRLLMAHWYENRGVITVGHEVAELPQSVRALIAPYRVLSL